MTEINKNPMPDYREHKLVDPLAPLKWLGRKAISLVSMHQLASHGDHFQRERGAEAFINENIDLTEPGTPYTYPEQRDGSVT